MSDFELWLISPPVMLVTHIWAFTPIGWAFNLVVACLIANAIERVQEKNG